MVPISAGIYLESMKGFFVDIEKAALENENFRKVLYTARNSQLVLMSLAPGEEIGEEGHELDQFIRIEAEIGKAVLDGVEHAISDDSVVIVPQGARHNIVNSGSTAMKLYTLYSPPNHRHGTIHKTKADAQTDEEHFDGTVSS